MYRTACKRKNKFAALQAAGYRRLTARWRTLSSSLQTYRARAATYLGKRFADHVSTLSTVSPLSFLKHTKLVVKSDAAKKKEYAADLATKEAGYKITAQYSDGLTVFIPALISQMISRRMKTEKLTFVQVKRLISTMYWSLRIYLNVDPFETKYSLSDASHFFRFQLGEEMEERAQSQAMEQPQRAAIRHRFQPGRLHMAPSSDRFRHDWLRAFFPRKHSLFQEDPDDYGNLPIATSRIRRLMASGYGISNWGTGASTVNLETRSRQILTLRHSRPRTRFETMLQGARRLPDAEDNLPAESTTIGDAPTRTSFFARYFSSSTTTNRGTVLVGRLLQQRRRLVSFKEGSLPSFVAVASRYRVKARIEARGRTNFAAGSKLMMVGGSLDPRFLRYKSPRSRQYFIRLPRSVLRASKQEKFTKLSTFHTLRRNRELLHRTQPGAGFKELWVRTNRRYVYNSYTAPVVGLTAALLSRARAAVPLRRIPTQLEARKTLLKKQIAAELYQNFPNRRQEYASTEESRAIETEHRTVKRFASLFSLAKGQHGLQLRKLLGHRFGVESGRSVLQYRRASQRTRRVQYKADRVLRDTAIAVRPAIRGLAAGWRSVLSRYARKSVIAHSRREMRRTLKDYNPTSKKHRQVSGSSFERLFRESFRLRKMAPIIAKRVHIQRKFSQLRVNYGPRFVTNFRSCRLIKTPAKMVTNGVHFFLRAGARVGARFSLTDECRELEEVRQAMPFDTYRPQLWNDLTLRWMKKERTMRFWLKDTKRWLRDPWVSEIIAAKGRIKTDNIGGEVGSIDQQIGQYVPEVDDLGQDIPEEEAEFVEREPRAETPASVVTVSEDENLVPAGRHRKVIAQRLKISREARRKPIPAMWLANHEFKSVIAEIEAEREKSHKQLLEEEQAKVTEYWRRKKAGEPQVKPRRPALKHPADHWLPAVVWKEIQRRARRLEWRESDELFFRKGFRNAFRFYPSERNRAPWLEALMYNRSLYSTRLGEYRRRQFPREQKRFKWLQRVRKALFPSRTAKYIKGRRWPRLRIYNQKLFYTLFNLPDRNAARRHFRKLNRRRGKPTSFAHSQRGLGDRLDVTLMHLNVAPSIFWARVVAPQGLLRVNGKVVKDPAYRISAGDLLQLEWDKVVRFRHFFKPALNRREAHQRPDRFSTGAYPANFIYHPGTRAMIYRGLPKESDLRRSNRLQGRLFRWFKLDSV
jgi:ribosomal protein S4